MSVEQVVGLVAAALVALTAIVVALVTVRSTSIRTTNEIHRVNIEALKDRVSLLEYDKQALHDENALLHLRVQALESANKALADSVSGATSVALLSEQLKRQHADVMALLGVGRQSDA